MEVENKIPRIRSVAYPSYTIEFCVDLTKRINQKFGDRTFNSREHIAELLGISVGHITTQLSSGNYYGLLELKSKEGYKPTERFRSIYKYHTEEEKRRAQIECLLSPELYKKIIENYSNGGQIPEVEGLAKLLYRSYKVAEDASDKAARIFLQNLNDLGLLDENRKLIEISFDTKQEIGGNLQEVGEKKPTSEPMQTQTKNISLGVGSQKLNLWGSLSIPIPLKNDEVATVALPNGYDADDLEEVIQWLTFIKSRQKNKAANTD